MYRIINGVWVWDSSADSSSDTSLSPTYASFSSAAASGTTLTPFLNTLPATQSATITFSDGLNNDGSLANETGWRLNAGSNPPSYSNVDSAHKWGGGVAGTSGGTVNYVFDPASSWTRAEEASFSNAFQLWSDVANVTFTLTTDPSTAQVGIFRYSSTNYPTTLGNTNIAPQGTGAYATADNAVGNVGDTTIPSTNAALISIQTVGSFQNLSSFTVNGGYGVGTVVHEIGHVLGLDHTGPYNADETTTNYAPFQFSPYDVYTYSIMSYIEPDTTFAPYFNQYAVQGTSWKPTMTPFTPMPDDILAAQQLYGAPTQGALTTPETFGFNTTITDGARSFYDFTVDVNPVVTLYSTAATNTLDLSGWTTPSTVNLLPGTFSSADDLVNNIAIGYNTAITSFVGGSGNDFVTANGLSDSIDGGGGDNVVKFANMAASYTMDRSGNVVTVGYGSVIDTLSNITTLQFSDESIDTTTIPCFATGTRLQTPDGLVAVEALRIGDLVTLQEGGTAPIRWIGRRSVDLTRHARPDAVRPVRVRTGAFGRGLPACDLVLSPDHAVFAEGVLIPVKILIDGEAIRQQKAKSVTYWHIELPRHAIILAEGLPVESYLDSGDRSAFEGGGRVLTLHADFTALAWEGACAPLNLCGEAVEATRARLRCWSPPSSYRNNRKGAMAPA